jgi:ADP-heptose:LPS heptosyltransferase
MLKKWLKKWGPNPLDQIIRKAKSRRHKTFLIFWNRGLGDIPLGLYAVVYRIRASIPKAKITFLTRQNLNDGFILMGSVEIIVAPDLKRGDQVNLKSLVDTSNYDVVIEKADPTHWVSWQLGNLIPELHWQEKWDSLCEKYDLDPHDRYIGAHVKTETSYASWRDWPSSFWEKLFNLCTKGGFKVLLFGYLKDPAFNSGEGVIDLRGQTPLFDLLSIVKNRCEAIVVPDSGISSMVYFLKDEFPIKHISLWAEPGMGILRHRVPSPNSKLKHIPLMAKERDISTIKPEEVYAHL